MAEDVQAPVNSARTSFTPLPDAKQVGDLYVALPKGNKDGVEWAHARQTILVEPQALYELWKDETSYPLWMEHVVSVTPGEGKTSHWVIGDPEDADGKRIQFDSELTEDVPGQKIAWKSTGGEVEQSGSVEFKARKDGRGTVVTLIQGVKVGALASFAASVAKRGPKQTVIEDLRHFKQMAEAGEIPSVKGQAHGPRGMSGGIKEWMYGETNPTPPGTSEGPLTAKE
ncbi:SRPBCC family protein [Granulicella tundricola]|nr:SRPBCC family protein [Granulicella tundricola]